MHERVRFIDHQGKKILLVDLSNCPANEVEEVARAVPDYLTVNPRDSVLVLTDFTGAVFDRDAVRVVKETAVFDKPFVNVNDLESMVMWTGIPDLDLWLVQSTLPLPSTQRIGHQSRPQRESARFRRLAFARLGASQPILCSLIQSLRTWR